MKRYIAYAVAALVGFHLRWTLSAMHGWSYSMNGIDLLNAMLCVGIVWSFIGAFMPEKKGARKRDGR